MKKVAIGGGQGFWGDSPDAAIHMIRNADIQYMGCDYLAELTLSIMAKQQLKDPTKGFAPDFTTRILKEAGKEAWDKPSLQLCSQMMPPQSGALVISKVSSVSSAMGKPSSSMRGTLRQSYI